MTRTMRRAQRRANSVAVHWVVRRLREPIRRHADYRGSSLNRAARNRGIPPQSISSGTQAHCQLPANGSMATPTAARTPPKTGATEGASPPRTTASQKTIALKAIMPPPMTSSVAANVGRGQDTKMASQATPDISLSQCDREKPWSAMEQSNAPHLAVRVAQENSAPNTASRTCGRDSTRSWNPPGNASTAACGPSVRPHFAM